MGDSDRCEGDVVSADASILDGEKEAATVHHGEDDEVTGWL